MERGWECCSGSRPGTATRGQQQPAVGHKSSVERPTRQGESSGHSGAAAGGATGYPDGVRWGQKTGGEGVVARQARDQRRGASRPGQAGQVQRRAATLLPRGEGAGKRQHPPGSRQGGRAVPSAVLVLLAAREGSSVARSVRCREATHPPAHLGGTGGGTIQRQGPASHTHSQRQSGRHLHGTGGGRGQQRQRRQPSKGGGWQGQGGPGRPEE